MTAIGAPLPRMGAMCAWTPARLAHAAVAALLFLIDTAPARAANFETLFSKHAAGSTLTIDHSAWTYLLESYVVPAPDGVNRVDYARFKASDHHATLKAYIKRLEAADPLALDRAEQFAFWANLYNAKTIDIVLDAYPVKSIKDINLGGGLVAAVTGGPWKAQTMKVTGLEISLNDIEHGILRPIWKDPRVHYAVNCASIGCPNLMTEAFTGAKLDSQLDAGARAYVNHPRGLAITSKTVRASSIYDWFQADFGGEEKGVLSHVRKYASPELSGKIEGMKSIDGYDYDWSLNDVKK